MKITILNGDPQKLPARDYKVWALQHLGSEHEYRQYDLVGMNIKQCTGCWNCWVKTPGVCAINDDAEIILRSILQSDILVFASPVVAGFTSSLLKRIQDRLVALIHPYIVPLQGECHHRKRYDKYPDLALMLVKDTDTDDEDIQIITDMYHRLALNFHGKLLHVLISDNITQENTTHELSHI